MRNLTRSNATLLALVAVLGLGLQASAEIADISPVPLANSPSDAVKPNLMYILDDSGSMNYNYMPDQIFRSSQGNVFANCKRCAPPNTVESVANSTEKITLANNHNGTVGSQVIFTYGTPPAPLALGTTYYIAASTANDTFILSAQSPGLISAVNTGTETITTAEAHGLAVNDRVVFSTSAAAGTAVPGGITAGTVYFVKTVPSSTTFTISTTSGGTVLNLTSTTAGGFFAKAIDITGTSTGALVVVGQSVNNVNTTSEQITSSSAHNGSVGSTVIFTAGIPPSGSSGTLLLNTPYFMSTVPSGTTFTLSTTLGGATLDVTASRLGASFIVDGGCRGAGAPVSAGNTPAVGATCGNDDNDPNNLADGNTNPTYGEAPFYSTGFNQIYYNPDITYSPAVDYVGTSLGNQSPTAARRDYFLNSTTDNIATAYPEVYYCTTPAPSAAERTNTNVCRRNGIHNVAPFLGAGQPDYFLYWNTGTAANMAFPTQAFAYKVLVTTSTAHYFTLSAHEYCSDPQMTTCALATAAGASPGGGFTVAAPIRWCKTTTDASSPLAVSGNSGAPATPRCRKNFDTTNYPYPRYGRLKRTDIATGSTFAKGPNAIRTDCATSVCSYTEEIQNFANWYSYYRNRLALMKTATGRAFLSIDDRYRIGFITINPNNPVTSSKYLALNAFDAAAGGQKQQWYTKLYAQAVNGSTPLREALSRVGRHYAGKTTGINSGMSTDPIQYSCQQNFALLTTDGYWNGNGGQDTGGAAVGNQDSSDSGFSTRSFGAYDGALAGAEDTLADVAMYYYKNDLRTSGPVSDNNVSTSDKDTAAHQHMVTFTLGLGLKGLMEYIPNYEVAASGDFKNIKNGTSGACSWTAGTCNWPIPVQNQPSALDDLWHAAVNGRGQYFSAGDPNSLAQGLQSALNSLNVQTAAASAAATSSPNITQTDNFIYSSTFRTAKWDGEVVARRIDTTTGIVLPAVEWSAQALLDGKTSAAADTRVIYTIDEAAAGKRKTFNWASLSSAVVGGIAAERTYFANKCGAFSQCSLLTISQQALANDGNNLVNYLRGQRENESVTAPETTSVFRAREHVLGDPVNAVPAFVAAPRFSFIDAVTPDYDTFKTANETRQKMLYVAANDGMLHALNATNGSEVWAYVPRISMPKMHRLATSSWGATHEFLVDGSPRTMDIFSGGAWKTILVAGMNSGGRGYYALDVTNPTSPQVLWEFCSTSAVCANWDADMGLTYGSPVIVKRPTDGKWVVVVTSGLNNVAPGDGKGYLYVLDAATGAKLAKVGTGAGDTTTPSGFSKIAGFADTFFTDATTKTIYGGDLLGNVWKFDMTVATPTVLNLAQLKDSGGKPQPITTRPELAEIDTFPVVYIGTGRYYGTDDLVDPATLVPALPWAYKQSLYAIKDRNVALGNFRTGAVVQNSLIDGGTTRTTTNNVVDWATKDGWFMDFNPGNTSPGERVNLDMQLIQGTLIVITIVPSSSACTIGGESWFYTFDYKSGVKAPAATVGGTKLPNIIVGAPVVRTPGGQTLVEASDNAGNLPRRIPVPTGGNASKVRRVSWRELVQLPQ